MLGDVSDQIEIVTVAKSSDPVPSYHGQKIVVDKLLSEKNNFDLLVIPGGDSALIEAEDEELMQWIRQATGKAERVMAVCTGTVLLGMTGVLDGRKATTNKLNFTKTVQLAPNVEWVKEARWVEDGKFLHHRVFRQEWIWPLQWLQIYSEWIRLKRLPKPQSTLGIRMPTEILSQSQQV